MYNGLSPAALLTHASAPAASSARTAAPRPASEAKNSGEAPPASLVSTLDPRLSNWVTAASPPTVYDARCSGVDRAVLLQFAAALTAARRGAAQCTLLARSSSADAAWRPTLCVRSHSSGTLRLQSCVGNNFPRTSLTPAATPGPANVISKAARHRIRRAPNARAAAVVTARIAALGGNAAHGVSSGHASTAMVTSSSEECPSSCMLPEPSATPLPMSAANVQPPSISTFRLGATSARDRKPRALSPLQLWRASRQRPLPFFSCRQEPEAPADCCRGYSFCGSSERSKWLIARHLNAGNLPACTAESKSHKALVFIWKHR
mmetsp:Transcript_43776/g.131215  ORF Transcript_43776/g.131215 Transcript_43776/m.131215 type:complete len:320 (+) Transcript_43776:524-1483(+)